MMMSESNSHSRSPAGLGYDSSPDFIVLTPPGSGNGDRNSELQDSMSNFGFPINMASLTSSHLSIEEALKRVMELMKENQELKDTLFKSNQAMKQACKTLETWKEENDKEKEVFQKERKEFHTRKEQAREVVEGLRTAVLDRDTRIQVLEKQAEQLMQFTSDRATPSMQKEILGLRNQTKQSYEEVENAKRQLEEFNRENKTLKQQNDELLQDNAMIQDSENDLKMVIQALKDEKKALDQEFANIHENHGKMKELVENMQIEKRDLVALNNDLSSQLHTMKSSVEGEYFRPGLSEQIQAAVDDVSGQDHENLIDLQTSEPIQHLQSEMARRSPAEVSGQHARPMGDLLIQMQEERGKVKELMRKLSEKNEANEELQKTLNGQEQENHQLSSQLKDAQQRQAENKAKVDQLYKQIDSMQQELQIQQDQHRPPPVEDIQAYRAQVYSLCEELKVATQNLESATDNNRLLEERCQQLQNKCILYQEEIENQRSRDDQLIEALRVTITGIEANLHTQQAKFGQKSTSYDELRKKFDSLVKDYHELLQCNEDLQANQTPKIVPTTVGLGEDIKKQYEQQIDHLTAQIVGGEEALKKRDNKLKELGAENEMLAEQVPVLNAQAEVYRQDFEAERSAREAQHTEKEALREEIKQLQVRNQQLQDEVQNLSHAQIVGDIHHQRGGQHPYYMQPSPPGATWQEARGQPTATPVGHAQYFGLDQCDEDPAGPLGTAKVVTGDTNRPFGNSDQTYLTENPYVCPKCNGNFQSMNDLQLHVMECID